MNLSDLPASVREIAEVIGREPALRLINSVPKCVVSNKGQKDVRPVLYVPKRLPPDHRLVEILGWADAHKLVQAFGGEILYPANCRSVENGIRNRYVAELAAIGYTNDQIADKLGVTPRTVRNIMGREKQLEAD